MAIFDPLTNLFTNYGFEATETDANADNVTDASAATNSNAIVGAAPVTSVDIDVQIREPGPDNFSQLGDYLKLEIFNEHLFVGAPVPGQPVQGFLNNCPLIAVLTAMTHVPQMRDVLNFGGIVRERVGTFSTFRKRQAYEYLQNDQPSKLPRLPSSNSNFEGNRFFAVNFYQNPRQAYIGPKEQITIWFAGHIVTRLISPVFYKFEGNNDLEAVSLPLHLYYSHSTNRALYPSAIEKAYVYLKSRSPDNVNYQKINNGLPLDEVMFDLAGYARFGTISKPPPSEISVPLLPKNRWKSWLKQHNVRPTVLASKGTVADPNLVVADHAYPVIGYNESAKEITVVNVLKEAGEANRVITIPFAKIKTNFIDLVQGSKEYGTSPHREKQDKEDID